MVDRELAIIAYEHCRKNTTCEGCPHHRMRGVEKCPVLNNVREVVRELTEDLGYSMQAVKNAQKEIELAVQCIYEIEDALDRGSDNDYAREAIKKWENAIKGEKR